MTVAEVKGQSLVDPWATWVCCTVGKVRKVCDTLVAWRASQSDTTHWRWVKVGRDEAFALIDPLLYT